MQRPAWFLLVLMLNALMLIACDRESGTSPTSATPSPAPVAATAAAGRMGIDIAGMDISIKPGDDFDAYANGEWREKTEIPADRSSIGVGYQVFQKAEERTAELIRGAGTGEPAENSALHQIADFYAAYMDEANIEALGTQPLKDDLAAIEGITNLSDLSRVLGSTLRADVDPLNATSLNTERLFGLFVAQSLDDPQVQVGYLMQGGIGLPDRDYYLSDEPAMADFRAAYRDYIKAVLILAGDADAAKHADAIFTLENGIAQAHASVTDTMDVHKANNPWTLQKFAQNAPGLEWTTYFDAAGLAKQKLLFAWQPEAIRGISALVASESIEVWKAFLRFHALNHSAALLPKAYADLQFDFYWSKLQGIKAPRERWKLAVAATNSDLADAVGQHYVEKFFPAASKAQVESMVANITAAFVERVDALDWMSPETRTRAKEKAQAIRVSVGYPATWRDYSTLEIRRHDPLGNRLRAERFEYAHQLAKLGKPADRGEWWMSAQLVNAVNLPLQNALNFPAAILEAPLFDPAADAAANYGAIGAIIGHEISHSFDNLGAEFDATGRLANWWTATDSEHFHAAGARLAAQYDAYEALPGLHIIGAQTLGENIADVSGLSIAYAAYRKSLGGQPAEVVEGLSGDQRFFIAYAQAWRGKVRDEALRQQVVTNVHAPGRFRAQTVRNLDAWYAAFGAQPGQALYLAPEQRVRIW